jgi:hypothetical protein
MFAGKANKASVANALHRKANKVDVEQALSEKTDKEDFVTLAQAVDSKADEGMIEQLIHDMNRKLAGA